MTGLESERADSGEKLGVKFMGGLGPVGGVGLREGGTSNEMNSVWDGVCWAVG